MITIDIDIQNNIYILPSIEEIKEHVKYPITIYDDVHGVEKTVIGVIEFNNGAYALILDTGAQYLYHIDRKPNNQQLIRTNYTVIKGVVIFGNANKKQRIYPIKIHIGTEEEINKLLPVVA